jgi:hypothetical protein
MIMAKLPEIPNRAPYIERAIHRALSERQEKEQKAPFLSMSEIGGCERNLWAGLHEIPQDKEIEPRILALFELGKHVEIHVIELLRASGRIVWDVDPETNEQFHYTDFDNRFRGRTDGMIELGSSQPHRALLEIKSANQKQFDLLIEVGYAVWHPKYADQLCVYMGYADLKEALVIVYCKNDSRLYAERLKSNPVRFHALRLKAGRILEAETTLPRPEEAKSQYCGFCKWCSRNQWCWSSTADVQFDE